MDNYIREIYSTSVNTKSTKDVVDKSFVCKQKETIRIDVEICKNADGDLMLLEETSVYVVYRIKYKRSGNIITYRQDDTTSGAISINYGNSTISIEPFDEFTDAICSALIEIVIVDSNENVKTPSIAFKVVESLDQTPYNELEDKILEKYEKEMEDLKKEVATKVNTEDVYSRDWINTKFTNYYTNTEVYNKNEINTSLNLKADKSQLDLKANKTDVYTKNEVNNALLDKANRIELDLKANKTDVYTRTETNTALNLKADKTQLDAKANKVDVYTKSEVYAKGEVYSKAGVDTLLRTKAESDNVYTKNEVYTKAQTDSKVDTKANQNETYTKLEVDASQRTQDTVLTTLTKATTDLRTDVNAILGGTGGQPDSSDEVKDARTAYDGTQRASLKLAMDHNVDYLIDMFHNPNPYQININDGDYIDGTPDDTDIPMYNIKGRSVRNLMGHDFRPSTHTAEFSPYIATQKTIQNGKTYTVICYVTEIRGRWRVGGGIFSTQPDLSLGLNVFSLLATDANDVKNIDFFILSTSGNDIFTHDGIMLLEGDWTNRDIPEYFEGTKSLAEDEGQLEILVNDTNLYDGNVLDGEYSYEVNDEFTYNVTEILPGEAIQLEENDASFIGFNGRTLKNHSIQDVEITTNTDLFEVEMNSGDSTTVPGVGACNVGIQGQTLQNLFVWTSNATNINYTTSSVSAVDVATKHYKWTINTFTGTPSYAQCNMTYNLNMLKPSTEYTLFITYGGTINPVNVRISNHRGTNNASNQQPVVKGFNVVKLTTYDTYPVNTDVRLITTINHAELVVDSTFEISKVMILEGDYTNKPIPDYFEGIKHFEVSEFKTTGKNLFDMTKWYDTSSGRPISWTANEDGDLIPSVSANSYHYNLNVRYGDTIYLKGTTNFPQGNIRCYRYGQVGTASVLIGGQFNDFHSDNVGIRAFNHSFLVDFTGVLSIRVYTINKNCVIKPDFIISTTPITSYEPYTESKQTFDPPLQLGQWDSLDYMGNKTTGMGRCSLSFMDGTFIEYTNTYRFILTFNDQYYGYSGTNANGKTSSFIFNNILKDVFVFNDGNDNNHIAVHKDSIICFILKSKFTSVMTESSIKALFTPDNSTFYYELATPTKETIPQSKLQTYSTTNLFHDSVVPPQSIKISNDRLPLQHLKTATQYTVNNSSDLKVSIAGSVNSSTTPATLKDESLILYGVANKKVSKTTVTEGNQVLNYDYFEGVKSIGEEENGAITFRAVGKNLINGEDANVLTPILPGTYHIKSPGTKTTTGGWRLRIRIYDKDKQQITSGLVHVSGASSFYYSSGTTSYMTGSDTSIINNKFTVPSNTRYISFGGGSIWEELMLVKDGANTTYEPYKESIQTVQTSGPIMQWDKWNNDGSITRGSLGVNVPRPAIGGWWNLTSTHIGFQIDKNMLGLKTGNTTINARLYCNIFPVTEWATTSNGSIMNENLYIRGYLKISDLENWNPSWTVSNTTEINNCLRNWFDANPCYIIGEKSSPTIEQVAPLELRTQGYTHFFMENSMKPSSINVATTSTKDRTDFIMVMSNSPYVISYNGVEVSRTVKLYDANKNYLGTTITASRFNTPTNCWYIKILGFDTALLQIEQGDTVSQWEHYRSNLYTLPCPPLRSTIDGTVFDEIMNDTFVQRVDENLQPLSKEIAIPFGHPILKSFATRNHIWFKNKVTPDKEFTIEYIASTGQIVANNMNRIQELTKSVSTNTNEISGVKDRTNELEKDMNTAEIAIRSNAVAIAENTNTIGIITDALMDGIFPTVIDHESKINVLQTEVDKIHHDLTTHIGGSFSAKTIVANMFSHTPITPTTSPRIWISDLKIFRADGTIINEYDIHSATVYFYGSKDGKEICFKTIIPLINAIYDRIIVSDYEHRVDIMQYIGLVITFNHFEDIKDVEYRIAHDVPANKIDIASSLFVWNDYVENSDPLYDQFNLFNSAKGHIYGLDYDNPQNIPNDSGTFKFTVPEEKPVTLKEEIIAGRGGWYSLDYRLNYIEKELDNYRTILPLLQGEINNANLHIGNLQKDMAAMLNLYLTVFVPRLKTVEAALGIDAGDGVTPPGTPRPTVTWEHANYQETNLTAYFYTNDVSWDDAVKYDWVSAGMVNNQQASSGVANTWYQYNWGHARTCVCVWKTDMPGWSDSLADPIKVALFNHWWLNNVKWIG